MTAFLYASARRLLVPAACGALFLALFWPTFGWMSARFSAADSFYSHGWLVPLATAWLVWQRRDALARARLAPSSAGLFLLVPSVLLHLVAVWSRIHVLSGLMAVAAVWGLVWTIWGWPAISILRFPLGFLLFMVPLPGALLINGRAAAGRGSRGAGGVAHPLAESDDAGR
jgi:hypothetical protein